MSRPLRIQYPDAYYHVTCRGNERREIFRDSEDRSAFLRLLTRSVEVFEVHLLAYALMPNHFHLLVRTPKSNLSEFMRHFNISYTGSFNRTYDRSGHLYQGRYKSFLIDADNYLLEVSRYIHLNPLRMKSKEPLDKRWQDLLINDSTSLPGYLNQKNRKTFVHYATILNYFDGDGRKSSHDYKKFVAEGMGKDIPSPLEKGKGTGIIGKEDFVEEIKALFGKDQEDRKSQREQPALRELGKIMTPEELIDRYTQLIKINREDLTTKGKQSTHRAMLMELLYRFCKVTQPEIGRLLGGIDYSAVSQSRKRLRQKIQNEPEWGEKFTQIQSNISQMSRVKI
ncbi:MAG: transposase [Deltaproteobacteria bacterium]